MRHERARDRAARQRLHHRGLDFEEAAYVEEAPEIADDRRTGLEHPPRFGVHGEIEITLAVTHLDVLQPVPLLRKGPQALGEKDELLRFTVSSPVRVLNTVPETPIQSPKSSAP
jgi:hypothetical protein